RHSHGAGRARRHQPDSRRRPGGGGRGCRRRALDALMRPRIFVTQPIADSAVKRLRKKAIVKVNPDASRVPAKRDLIAMACQCDIRSSPLHDRIDGDGLEATPHILALGSRTNPPDNFAAAAAPGLGTPGTVTPPLGGEATADIAFGL